MIYYITGYRGKKAGRARQMNKQNQRNFVGFLYTVMETCSGEAKWNNRGNKRGGGRGGRGGEGEEKARALATIKKYVWFQSDSAILCTYTIIYILQITYT